MNKEDKIMGVKSFFSAKFWHIFDKLLSGWSILIMATMSIFVILSVIFRYVFNVTYAWSEEAIVLLFIFTTYFGSVLCVKEKEHIDIPFLRERVSEKVGYVMDIFICIFNILVQLSLSYISIGWIQKTGSSVSAGLKIPYYFIYSLFPICLVLMAIYTVRRLVNIVKMKKNNAIGGKQ